jgi:hypothetical protein
MKTNQTGTSPLDGMKENAVSGEIDEVFRSVIKEETMSTKAAQTPAIPEPGELALEGELDIGLALDDAPPPEAPPLDEGMDLAVGGAELDIGELDEGFDAGPAPYEQFGDLSLDGDAELAAADEADPDERTVVKSFSEAAAPEESSDGSPDALTMGAFNVGGKAEALDLGGDEESLDLVGGDESLDLGGGDESLDLVAGDEALDLGGGDEALDLGGGDESLDLGGGDEPPMADLTLGGLSFGEDLSEDARKKLEEIDAIMDLDASQVNLAAPREELDAGLDEPLVSPDLDLEGLSFDAEVPAEDPVPSAKEPRKKKKDAEPRDARDRNLGEDLREISGAYSGEMERLQATISNLRTDRDELLAKIAKFEEEKVLEKRQALTLRAELDERKIELTIIRKKLNEEIGDLKDRLKLYEEKRLILEERNRVLLAELDKAAQKNKIDVKKVQLRERELEQKLELLKADAETQIRNRDLKILELKRKIDSMEFDMESISQQEKRSVESRYELEDKLEKAIKTLRSAITVLEDETDRTGALNALKKNIDM